MRMNLSIVKFEINIPELREALDSFAKNRVKALETLVADARESVGNALNQLLNAEMSMFLGEADQLDNKRNGFQIRNYVLKGIGSIRIKVPLDRKRRFESTVIPKGERIDPRITQDMAALHLAGISTRTLSMMSQRILGINVSHQTVSSALPSIGEHARLWLKRPLNRKFWCLIVDGTYFNIRRRNSVEKEPSLIVLGIDESNRRSVLCVEPGSRDSADNWRVVFRELKARGLDFNAVKIGVMDGLPGLEKVFKEEFPSSITARCWFHAMRNALSKAPKRLVDAFHLQAKRVMYAKTKIEAKTEFAILKETMKNDAQRSVECLEKDFESLTSHMDFPLPLHRALKTTNSVERIHKEFKRRSRPMEGMSEATLETLVAFTVIKLEMTWRRRGVDSYAIEPFKKLENIYEEAENELLLN